MAFRPSGGGGLPVTTVGGPRGKGGLNGGAWEGSSHLAALKFLSDRVSSGPIAVTAVTRGGQTQNCIDAEEATMSEWLGSIR